MLSERSDINNKPNASPISGKIALKRFTTPRSSGGLVMVGITNEENHENFPVAYYDQDEDG